MPNVNPLAVTGLIGGLVAYWLTGFLARRAGAGREVAAAAQDIVPNLVIGGVLGAKLVYILLDPGAYLSNPMLLVFFPYGPWALPAGMVGAAAAVAWALRRRPERLQALDLAAGPLGVGLAIALAGWSAPGSWAFAPLVGVASLGALALGPGAARTAILLAGAVALADQARPGGAFSTVQLTAAILGTVALVYERKKNPGA